MKIIFRIFFLLLIAGCGHKKNLTGGPEDTEKPVILNVYPSQYEDIRDKDIEITFSKQMDQGSFYTGLYIYPGLDSRYFKWEDNTLIIEIREELQDSTNYFFSFTENIKGIHKNPLDKQYDLVWCTGTFYDHQISGHFSYEEEKDKNEEVRISLFSADTTLINTRIFQNNYSYEGLNHQIHLLRAYIDKNGNRKLNTEKEPFAEAVVAPRKTATVNLHLAYQDSTAPVMKKIRSVFEDEIDITFDEKITALNTLHIFTADSLKHDLRIRRWRINGEKVKVFISKTDTIDYIVQAIGASDKKNNVSESDTLRFKGITKVDTVKPEIIKILPRNGASTGSLKPEIRVTFSEVLFKEDVNAWLTETETGIKFPIKTIQGDNETFIFLPLTNLNNFNTYKIEMTGQDPRRNELVNFEGSIFLPVVAE